MTDPDPTEDYIIVSRDLRVGMGVGGWDMEWTILHRRTGIVVTYQTHGSNPSQRRMRQEVIAMIEMLAAHYTSPDEPDKSGKTG